MPAAARALTLRSALPLPLLQEPEENQPWSLRASTWCGAGAGVFWGWGCASLWQQQAAAADPSASLPAAVQQPTLVCCSLFLQVEPAKSGRAECQACHEYIGKVIKQLGCSVRPSSRASAAVGGIAVAASTHLPCGASSSFHVQGELRLGVEVEFGAYGMGWKWRHWCVNKREWVGPDGCCQADDGCCHADGCCPHLPPFALSLAGRASRTKWSTTSRRL